MKAKIWPDSREFGQNGVQILGVEPLAGPGGNIVGVD